MTRARSRILWISAGAAAAALLLAMHALTVPSVFHAAIVFMLCCSAVHDIETRRIENAMVLVLAGLRVYELVLAGIGGVFGWGSVLDALAGSFAAAVMMLAVLLVTVRLSLRLTGSAGIGGGDVKLLCALAFWFGWEAGLVIAALSCLLLVAAQPLLARLGRRETFAFAPFIAVSSVLLLLIM